METLIFLRSLAVIAAIIVVVLSFLLTLKGVKESLKKISFSFPEISINFKKVGLISMTVVFLTGFIFLGVKVSSEIDKMDNSRAKKELGSKDNSTIDNDQIFFPEVKKFLEKEVGGKGPAMDLPPRQKLKKRNPKARRDNTYHSKEGMSAPTSYVN